MPRRSDRLHGSSPLARGTPQLLRPWSQGLRLIPARAGNTPRSGPRLQRPSAHPRSRGEHIQAVVSVGAVLGSSPLARGTHEHPLNMSVRLRLIPARAGNTDWLSSQREAMAAHPRSRGEHSAYVARDRQAVGSSPLARGTRERVNRVGFDERLIPARAGNTVCWRMPTAASTAHPRSRGEHSQSGYMASVASGSSPLARGTRVYRFPFTVIQRLIPARAGNTAKSSTP